MTQRPEATPPEFDEERTSHLLAAMRDPLQRRMLMVLGEDEDLTIRQVARVLDEPTRRIRHQMDALVDRGLVSIRSERPRRGTMERTFRTVRTPLLWVEDWPSAWPGPVEPTETKLILLDILRYTFDEVTAAIVNGTFEDRDGWCAARMVSAVDERGWRELAAIQQKAVREALAVEEAAAQRLDDSGEEPIRAITSVLLFEALPREPGDGA